MPSDDTTVPPLEGVEEHAPTLEEMLRAVADDLEDVLARATSAHLALGRAVAESRTWTRAADAVSDEVRSRRTDVGLYAAGLLVEQLRAEAGVAAERFPDHGTSGERVVPVPRGAPPAEVARWWAGLPEDDRAEVLSRSTSWVGRADGLPAAVRHRANLEVLEAELERRGHLLESLTSGADDEVTAEERRDLRGLLKLKALFSEEELPDQPVEGLDQVTTPLGDRYLYLLDARTYPLRTAIALGDPDTADHVVVHVPGTTTTVDLRLVREVTWMSWWRDETRRLLGGEETTPPRVAVIDWIGYQAPYDIATRKALGDTGMKLIVPGEASDPRYARQAADRLTRTLDGVRTITPPGARVVASGHSYGAAAMGLALMRLAHVEDSPVDAFVVAGAPGVFATTLEELGLAAGSVLACVAPGDLIGLLGVFGGEVLRIPGIQQLTLTARRVSYPDGGTAWLRPPVGHEQYYHRGTTSLHNLAAVVAGEPARARTSRPWQLRAGGSSASGATRLPDVHD